MLLKPEQLREALIRSVPQLTQNPDSLKISIGSGRIVSTLASSLSFEYQYQLNLVITDYAENIDLIMVPALAWLRENQPDIMSTEEKRRTGFTFKVNMISDTSGDITIDIQLTERVIVKQDGEALLVNHIGELPLPENVNRPLQLYVHGELFNELNP